MKNSESSVDELLKLMSCNEMSEMKNLGTFTAIHKNPLVEKYMSNYLRKNLVDKKLYTSLSYFQHEIDSFCKSIFNHVNGKTLVTSGSTESILLSLFYAKQKAKKEKDIIIPNIVLSKLTHYSFYKCAKILNIEVRETKLNDELQIDIEDTQSKIDKNTILIIGIMGSTELGTIDNFLALDTLANKNYTNLHIDAAIGGFIVPFLSPTFKFKFNELKSLISINISGHKFGLALPGCGLLLMKDKKTIEEYSDYLEYLSAGKSRMESLLITQSSLGTFSMAVNIMQYGYKGYESFAKKYILVKQQLIEALEYYNIPYFSGSPYIPQLFLYPDELKSFSEFLLKNNWLQAIYRAKGLEKEGIRVVIKKDQEEILINDFIHEVDLFYKNISIKEDVNNTNLLSV